MSSVPTNVAQVIQWTINVWSRDFFNLQSVCTNLSRLENNVQFNLFKSKRLYRKF